MNDLSKTTEIETTSRQTQIDGRDKPVDIRDKSDDDQPIPPASNPSHPKEAKEAPAPTHHEAVETGEPPVLRARRLPLQDRASETHAPETLAPPAEPAARRGGKRGLLLAGCAVLVVGGAVAAVHFQKPLLGDIYTVHEWLNTDIAGHTIKIPAPVSPAQRLGGGQTGTSTSGAGVPKMPAQPTSGTTAAPSQGGSEVGVAGSARGQSSSQPTTLAEIEALRPEPTTPMRQTGPGAATGGKATNSPHNIRSNESMIEAKPAMPLAATLAGRQPQAGAASGMGHHPGTVTPSNTLEKIAHPVRAAINLPKAVANGATPSYHYVISLAGNLGLVVAELRTENAHLTSEVTAMQHEMDTRFTSFDRRLTYEQAKARLALAGAPHPHLSPDDAPPTGVFPQRERPHTAPVSPSSYQIQAASPGLAILSRDGNPYEVSVGNIVPGVGRVLSIQQYGSAWVVQTTHGAIR